MGSSTTQDLSYKSHRVLLANYFASQLVTWTNGRWHEQAEDAGLSSSGLGGEGGNTSYILFPPFKRESQRGDVALPIHTVSSDKAGTPPKTTPPPFPNTSELPQ